MMLHNTGTNRRCRGNGNQAPNKGNEPIHTIPESRVHCISVLKFGGASFLTPGDYRRVASYIADRVRGGERICVVVSAMSGTTGRLRELLTEIARQPQDEDWDASLAVGEILAAALFRAAVAAEGVPAVSLNGFQLSWTAEDRYTASTLLHYPADQILTCFMNGASVVVVSGGQATTSDNRLVMLGRNSSDLTAIALAAGLGRRTVTLFSDIEGVCTADPYKLDNTRLIPELSYDTAFQYAEAGAKILHPTCVRLAQAHGIMIECAHLPATNQAVFGTRIGARGDGIQVLFPDHVPSSKIPPDTASGLVSDSWSASARRVPDCQDKDLQSVMIIHRDGHEEIHLLPVPKALPFAQSRHDELAANLPFASRIVPAGKRRGDHTDIFRSNK